MNQYPLWRYLLLAFLILMGVVYAVPNLYGSDPAIQVSAEKSAKLSGLKARLENLLQQNNIPYKRIVCQQTGNMLIRFGNTTDQLKAQDYIQATLGNGYVVAANLAARTPHWLQSLGAFPMRYGLDLQGGIHFLLAVDTDAMLKQIERGDLRGMADTLKKKSVHYTSIQSTAKHTIDITFRSRDALEHAKDLLTPAFSMYNFANTKGSTHHLLRASISRAELIKVRNRAVDQNIATMRNRVNALGVSEPVIVRQGADQISVDLPGIQDAARAKEMIGKVATIRLQLQDLEHDPNQAANGVIPFGSQLFTFEGRPILLKDTVILHGDSIVNATTSFGQDGRPAVSIRLNGQGASYFNQETAENVGKPLATVYVETKSVKKVVNGKVVTQHVQVERVINIATIQTALGNNFQITGLTDQSEAQNLALLLRSGAYAAPVDPVEERLVGPSLGARNIHQGLLSMEIAMAVVFVFMLLYYRLFGLIADMALLLNVVFIAAIASVLGVTLTLPGIAAIVLTVGMAVDANVLINERIREELRSGVSVQAAIHAGYDRAFTTIIDSNVTTLLVAIILFALGSGSVQGFAVMLIVGIITSMITAIFFTRGIVNLIYGYRSVKKISIGIVRHGIF